jgi:hypothetical protein
LNVPDTTIASGVETDVELFLDFLLHVCSAFSVRRKIGGLQVEKFAQDATRKARKLMIKLVSKTNVLPRHLFITDLEKDPQAVAVGGFGRVFKGKYGGQLVALKMLYQSRRPGVRGFSSLDFLMVICLQRIRSRKTSTRKHSLGGLSRINLYFLFWEYMKDHSYSLYHHS